MTASPGDHHFSLELEVDIQQASGRWKARLPDLGIDVHAGTRDATLDKVDAALKGLLETFDRTIDPLGALEERLASHGASEKLIGPLDELPGDASAQPASP